MEIKMIHNIRNRKICVVIRRTNDMKEDAKSDSLKETVREG